MFRSWPAKACPTAIATLKRITADKKAPPAAQHISSRTSPVVCWTPPRSSENAVPY
jgi:hypothetical protein